MKAQIVLEIEEEGLGLFLKAHEPSEIVIQWKDAKDGYYHNIPVSRVVSYNGPYLAEPQSNITWREGGYNSPKISVTGEYEREKTDGRYLN